LLHATLGDGPEATAIADRLRTEFPGFAVEGFKSYRAIPSPIRVPLRAIREAAKLVPIG